jgi:hypothetical protein
MISAFSASSSVMLRPHPQRSQRKKDFDSPKKRKNPNRREPGVRREDEIYIKWFLVFVFWKKTLCGLCVLCG